MGVAAVIILLQQTPQPVNNINVNETFNLAPTSLSYQVSYPIPSTGITKSIVEQNNTIDSCLVIYQGSVYKIPSDWVKNHPGGIQEITDSCGKDITEIFNQGQHDFNAKYMLSSFYISELIE